MGPRSSRPPPTRADTHPPPRPRPFQHPREARTSPRAGRLAGPRCAAQTRGPHSRGPPRAPRPPAPTSTTGMRQPYASRSTGRAGFAGRGRVLDRRDRGALFAQARVTAPGLGHRPHPPERCASDSRREREQLVTRRAGGAPPPPQSASPLPSAFSAPAVRTERERPRPRGSPGPRHGPPPHPTKRLRPAAPVRVHSQLPRPGAGPGVAGPGLHAGRRAPKADAALPAAPSPAGLAGRAAEGGRSEAPFRPPRPRPLPGRGLGASHSARPGPHSFFSQPRPRRQAAGPTERPRSGPAPTTHPVELCGRPPKLGWGRIPPTYIFPPPQPPPAVLSR